jgi:hypothetical protein
MPLSYFLGILGMPGMTAYVGLFMIGKPKQGETIFISVSHFFFFYERKKKNSILPLTLF